MKRRLAIICASIAAVFASALPVYADPAQPSPLQITDADAFRDLVENGDMLLLVGYNIGYAVLPADHAGVNFVLSVEYPAGTVVATATPYPYNDGGYGEGVISVYLSEAQTAALGLTDGSGNWVTWSSAAIRLELQGNATVFATQPITDYTLSAGNFSSGSGKATNVTQLGTRVIQHANALQAAWQVTLLVSGAQVLNDTDGAGYFALAIPGLRQIAPQIFSVQTESPTEPTEATTTGDFASAAEARWDASDLLIGGPTASLATDTGLPAAFWRTVGVLIVVGMVWFAAYKNFGPFGIRLALAGTLALLFPVGAVSFGASWQFSLALPLFLFGIWASIKVAREVWT